MSDESTSVDLSSGFDRRSALKKAAVAGAVVWTAPVLLSDSAQATQFLPGGCTAKCGPSGSVFVSGSATAQPCLPAPPPPGQQEVFAVIDDASAGAGSCGCDTEAVVVVTTPGAGTSFLVRPKPGSAQNGEFDIVATVSCVDRAGNTISSTCRATATAFIQPGNCQGAQNPSPTFQWEATLTCEGLICTPAED